MSAETHTGGACPHGVPFHSSHTPELSQYTHWPDYRVRPQALGNPGSMGPEAYTVWRPYFRKGTHNDELVSEQGRIYVE